MKPLTWGLIVLAALFIALLTACSPPQCDGASVRQAKVIESLADKPGGRVGSHELLWAQDIKRMAPQCWSPL